MQVNSTVASVATGQFKAYSQQKKEAEKSTQSANTQSAQLSSLSKDTIDQLKALGGKGMSNLYIAQYQQQALNMSLSSFGSQGGILDLLGANSKASGILAQLNLSSIGYTGKNILSMNKDELNQLISEDGFFGMENTANRIADFVISGAGNDAIKLQKGFEGMKRGFEQAEKIWGSKLPQLSQDTINKAIEKVSNRIKELGANAVNINA
ncbi:hypothetical protein [Campylobacter troglodytis]|uniref:hypothetical protein n=1 Tax=Campylobacter troglodytis TaxID=654363 RepID=UPI00115B4F9B|nr:hypothetical protein [Campylobacter troglodytis]TQR59034.1 hypothetical protein DMC01_07560 [Campylobacter troglodytis]